MIETPQSLALLTKWLTWPPGGEKHHRVDNNDSVNERQKMFPFFSLSLSLVPPPHHQRIRIPYILYFLFSFALLAARDLPFSLSLSLLYTLSVTFADPLATPILPPIILHVSLCSGCTQKLNQYFTNKYFSFGFIYFFLFHFVCLNKQYYYSLNFYVILIIVLLMLCHLYAASVLRN